MSFSEVLVQAIAAPQQWAWCPTMDLLAYVPTPSALHIHRLSWQRLLSVVLPAGANVQRLAWSPSGALFSVADSSGHLLLWRTEAGVLLQRRFVGTVRALAWTATQLDDAAALAARDSQCVQHWEDVVPVVLDAAADPPLLYAPTRLAPVPLLEVAVLTLDDWVELWARGACRIGRIAAPHVRSAWLAPDLRAVVYVAWDADCATVCCANTAPLAARAVDVAGIAAHAINMTSLADALAHSTQSARAAWRRHMAAVSDVVSALHKRLRECESADDVRSAIVDVLMCGTRVEGTSLWLETDLGERGAAKLAKGIQDGFAAVLEMLDGPLLNVAEQLCFRAAEMAADDELCCAELQRRCEVTFAQLDAVAVQVRAARDPLLSFGRWLWRTHKMIAFEEAVKSDATRRPEAEAALNAHRIAEPFDELHVMAFAEMCVTNVGDGSVSILDPVPRMFDLAAASVQAVASCIQDTTDALAPVQSGSCEVRTIFKVPVEELRDVQCCFVGDGTARVSIQRGTDDLALVVWEVGRADSEPQLSVYDAPEGDVVGAAWYKDAMLAVLCSGDTESHLHLVDVEGNEIKTRPLPGRSEMVCVSPQRGLGAVFGGGQCRLLDLEADEEDGDDHGGDNDGDAMSP